MQSLSKTHVACKDSHLNHSEKCSLSLTGTNWRPLALQTEVSTREQRHSIVRQVVGDIIPLFCRDP